jgi:hypothetical protein
MPFELTHVEHRVDVATIRKQKLVCDLPNFLQHFERPIKLGVKLD